MERYFRYKNYAIIKDKTSREGILARTHSLPVNAWGALGPGRPAPCGGRLLIIQRLSQLSNVVRGAAVLGGIIQVHRSYLRPTRRAAAGQNHSWDIFHPFTISSYRATVARQLLGLSFLHNHPFWSLDSEPQSLNVLESQSRRVSGSQNFRVSEPRILR